MSLDSTQHEASTDQNTQRIDDTAYSSWKSLKHLSNSDILEVLVQKGVRVGGMLVT